MSRACPSLLLLAIACAGGHVSAQEADDSYYDGTWSVRVPCHQRALCSARLVLSDHAGTWEELAGGSLSKGACHDKKVPLTVQKSTRSQLAFTVWGTHVAPDCPNLSVLVKPVNTRTLEGIFAFGVQELAEHDADHTTPSDLTKQLEATTGGAAEVRPPADRSIRMQRR
jgi:hypothetical protein